MSDYRIKGNEYEVKECPFCGNTRFNFTVNFSKGVWHSWCCNKGGSIDDKIRGLLSLTLREKMPEVSTDVSLPPLSVLYFGDNIIDYFVYKPRQELDTYIKSRNFTLRDVMLWGAKVRDGRYLIFPLYQDGKLVFWSEKDIKTGRWMLPENLKDEIVWYKSVNQDEYVILVEGVFDAMRVMQAGFNVIVLLGTAISTAVARFIGNHKLKPVLFLDADVKKSRYVDYKKKLLVFDIMEAPQGKDPDELSIEEVKALFACRIPFGFQEEIKNKILKE